EGALTFDRALERVDTVAASTAAITVTVHTAGTETFPDTLGRFDTGASSQLVLFLFLTALTGSAAPIEPRPPRVPRRMLATPPTPGTVIAGEAAGRLTVAILQGVVIMVGSALIF